MLEIWMQFGTTVPRWWRPEHRTWVYLTNILLYSDVWKPLKKSSIARFVMFIRVSGHSATRFRGIFLTRFCTFQPVWLLTLSLALCSFAVYARTISANWIGGYLGVSNQRYSSLLQTKSCETTDHDARQSACSILYSYCHHGLCWQKWCGGWLEIGTLASRFSSHSSTKTTRSGECSCWCCCDIKR